MKQLQFEQPLVRAKLFSRAPGVVAMAGPVGTASITRNSFTGDVDEHLFTFRLFEGLYLQEPFNHLSRGERVRVLRIKDYLNGTDEIEGLCQVRAAGKFSSTAGVRSITIAY